MGVSWALDNAASILGRLDGRERGPDVAAAVSDKAVGGAVCWSVVKMAAKYDLSLNIVTKFI
jgi:hypothetical protein